MKEKIINLLKDKDYKKLKKLLNKLQSKDIALILEEMKMSDICIIFKILPKEPSSEVFSYLPVELEKKVISHLTDDEITEVLSEMYLDDVVDLLEEMPSNMVKQILKDCPNETRETINKLLNYPKDSAGSLMTVEIPELKETLTIKESIKHLRENAHDYEDIHTIYVISKTRTLIGYLNLNDLIFNDTNELITDITKVNVVYCYTTDDKEVVANIFKKYDITTLPVVDSEQKLVGIITVDDILDVIESEATEDIHKIAGIKENDKPYFETSVFETFKNRIPWLLILMISGIFTTAIISGYENALSKYTVLTAFIPILMGTGGNAGGQVSVTIIRSLSLGEVKLTDIIKVLFKELKVSLICGLTLGIVNIIKMLIIDNTTLDVALTVSVALFLTVIIAKLIGSSLPILAKKIGLDPAVMASPFITTIVDAVSLLIYFKTACIILGI